jgi:hypothetical protein
MKRPSTRLYFGPDVDEEVAKVTTDTEDNNISPRG